MMPRNAIERLLKHCENVDKEHEKNKDNLAGNEYSEYIRNKGWVQAIKCILEMN